MRKYIVTHYVETEPQTPGVPYTGPTLACTNAYIVPNSSNKSVAALLKLAAEARKSFPDLKDNDIHVGIVVESGHCRFHPIVRFTVPPDTTMEGWTSYYHRLPDIIAQF